MANGNDFLTVDGSLSFEGGIDSGRSPTIASDAYPNGLKRNQLSWATNYTMRGGGVLQRTGWGPRVQGAPWSGLYQGGYMYEPGSELPYLMLDIGGRTYQVRVDTDNSVVDVTAGSGPNPAAIDQHWMVQGERFLVIQDGASEPLVWDGTVLRRISAVGGAHPKLPTGTAMDYLMGRIWVAGPTGAGRAYLAGDIVGSPGAPSSGTAAYQFSDSILNGTENAFLKGGGLFIVPTNAGNIRAIKHTANLDTALGEGQLLVMTRKTIYSVNVVPDRAQWQTLKEPLQRVAQNNFGTTSDRSVVSINGDLFMQSSPNGDIRSYIMALRYFHEWGNLPISRNMNRVLRFNDRALLRFGTGIEFDNRVYQSVLPYMTPAGVAHKGVMKLDFDLISSFQDKLPPAWEGIDEAMPVMEMFSGDFGGRQRAFAVVWSDLNNAIEVWELTQSDRTDNGVVERRIQSYLETPAYTWGNPFALKRLAGCELWIDKLFGTVEFELYYKPDQHPCWYFWHAWKDCAARSCREELADVDCPIVTAGYPTQDYCEQFRATWTLPKPPAVCVPTSKRPSIDGYQFQVKLVVKGWHRLRGLLLYVEPRDKQTYLNLVPNC